MEELPSEQQIIKILQHTPDCIWTLTNVQSLSGTGEVDSI